MLSPEERKDYYQIESRAEIIQRGVASLLDDYATTDEAEVAHEMLGEVVAMRKNLRQIPSVVN